LPEEPAFESEPVLVDPQAVQVRRFNVGPPIARSKYPALTEFSAKALEIAVAVGKRLGFESKPPAVRVYWLAKEGIMHLVPCVTTDPKRLDLHWSRDDRRVIVNLIAVFQQYGIQVPKEGYLEIPVAEREDPKLGLGVALHIGKAIARGSRSRKATGRKTSPEGKERAQKEKGEGGKDKGKEKAPEGSATPPEQPTERGA
jgi:hypothetical protein